MRALTAQHPAHPGRTCPLQLAAARPPAAPPRGQQPARLLLPAARAAGCWLGRRCCRWWCWLRCGRRYGLSVAAAVLAAGAPARTAPHRSMFSGENGLAGLWLCESTRVHTPVAFTQQRRCRSRRATALAARLTCSLVAAAAAVHRCRCPRLQHLCEMFRAQLARLRARLSGHVTVRGTPTRLRPHTQQARHAATVPRTRLPPAWRAAGAAALLGALRASTGDPWHASGC
jgi:hypothetical protein